MLASLLLFTPQLLAWRPLLLGWRPLLFCFVHLGCPVAGFSVWCDSASSRALLCFFETPVRLRQGRALRKQLKQSKTGNAFLPCPRPHLNPMVHEVPSCLNVIWSDLLYQKKHPSWMWDETAQCDMFFLGFSQSLTCSLLVPHPFDKFPLRGEFEGLIVCVAAGLACLGCIHSVQFGDYHDRHDAP